jgi:hypothetical protein
MKAVFAICQAGLIPQWISEWDEIGSACSPLISTVAYA